jgi:hypothetical protein
VEWVFVTCASKVHILMKRVKATAAAAAATTTTTTVNGKFFQSY